MKLNWGFGIATLYSGFVVFMMCMVSATFYSKTELVADDYYHQETIFQSRLDAKKATAQLSAPLHTSKDANGNLSIVFAKEQTGKMLTGHVLIYHPACAANDRTETFTTAEGAITIDQQKLNKPPYELQVSWKADGQDYYQTIASN